jgi:CheY-like chemotaxis protein
MGRPQRVLVVDDNRDTADMLAACVELVGARAKSVYSGRAAVEEAKTLEPDLVLLDLELPDATGASVARALRAVCDARVVVVTGHDADAVADELATGTFDAHVAKPCTLEVLTGLLGRP